MHLKTQLVTEIPFTGRTLNSTVLSTKWTCECVCVCVFLFHCLWICLKLSRHIRDWN